MPGDDHVPGDPPPSEDEFYDDETLARLDAWQPANTSDADGDASMSRLARWSRETTFGAAIRGSALGLQEILRPEPEPPIVIDVDEAGEAYDPPVRLYFDPASPSRSVAIVRPWLATRRPAPRRR